MENNNKKESQKDNPDYPAHDMVDDIIDYDGMGQGRFVSQNRR